MSDAGDNNSSTGQALRLVTYEQYIDLLRLLEFCTREKAEDNNKVRSGLPGGGDD